MKTIRKMILAFMILVGAVTAFSVLRMYAPEWMYYTVFALTLLLVLYYVSCPEKSYWYYTYHNGAKMRMGVVKSDNPQFPVIDVMDKKDVWPISVVSISKADYERLRKIEKQIKEESSAEPKL